MGGVPALVGAGLCDTDDGRSVVAFGDLKSGVVAAACTISEGGPVYDGVAAADGRINRAGSRWTAKLSSRSCRGVYYYVEAVMAHEWGHLFGLGHVP